MTSRRIVIAVVEAWGAEHPELPVPCYMVDVGDQCGKVWDAVWDWLTAEGQPASQLMGSGAGPLLWVRSGHVASHVLTANGSGADKLVAECRTIFATDARRIAALDRGSRSLLSVSNSR